VKDGAANVVTYGRAFLAGLAKHGVVGCGKHFPGLGGGSLDSHLETPAIQRNLKSLWDEDLLPYRELAAELPMVMVNHATYPATHGGDRPATASAYWVTSMLAKQIGYRGLIFSDDMEMGGILNFAPIEEAAILAVRAGIHLMEICHSPELILRAYESMIAEAEQSAAFCKLLLGRAAIATRLRLERFNKPMSRPLSTNQFAALREAVIRFGAEIEAFAAK
jgi:beta-N-acetylhexosaminidase